MHPLQHILPPDLGRIWLAALDDAGIPPAQALLATIDGTKSADGRSSVYLRSGVICEPDDVDGELLAELNNAINGAVGAHRVVLWANRGLEGAAALLRHELEHARQVDARPEVGNLHQLAECVVRGDCDSGRLYQQIPAEVDANAAAGVWVRSFFGADRIDRLIESGDPDASALRSTEPPSGLADLPDRMVAFLASIPDACVRWARDQNLTSFSRQLDADWRGAGAQWEQMTGLPRTIEGSG